MRYRGCRPAGEKEGEHCNLPEREILQNYRYVSIIYYLNVTDIRVLTTVFTIDGLWYGNFIKKKSLSIIDIIFYEYDFLLHLSLFARAEVVCERERFSFPSPFFYQKLYR